MLIKGESGPVQISPGFGELETTFESRGMDFRRSDEYASANYYSNILRAAGGNIKAEMTASIRTRILTDVSISGRSS
jgi:hypothetical protein